MLHNHKWLSWIYGEVLWNLSLFVTIGNCCLSYLNGNIRCSWMTLKEGFTCIIGVRRSLMSLTLRELSILSIPMFCYFMSYLSPVNLVKYDIGLFQLDNLSQSYALIWQWRVGWQFILLAFYPRHGCSCNYQKKLQHVSDYLSHRIQWFFKLLA